MSSYPTSTPPEGPLAELDRKAQNLPEGPSDARTERLLELLEGYAYTDALRSKALLDELYGLALSPLQRARRHIAESQFHNAAYRSEACIHHLEQALPLILREGSTTEAIALYLDLASAYSNTSKLDKAVFYINEAEKWQRGPIPPALRAQWQCRKAHLLLQKQTPEAALETFLAARASQDEETRLTLKDTYIRTLIESGLGQSFYHLKNYDDSRECYEKAIALCEQYQMGARLSWYYQKLGSCHIRLNNNELAIQYFMRSIEGCPQDSHQLSRASAIANIGQLMSQEAEYEKALAYFKRAESIFKAQPAESLPSNMAVLESQRAEIAEQQGDYANSEKHYLLALDWASGGDDNKLITNIHRSLADLYAGQQRFEAAYEQMCLSQEARERQVASEHQKNQHRWQSHLAMERQEQEIKRLQLQHNELQLKAMRSQMNPHFIFNCLSSIQHLIMRGQNEAAEHYLSKFAWLIRRNLENSERRTIRLEEEVAFLQRYLELEKLRFKDALSYEVSVEEDIEEDFMAVPPMIVQPFVENAILHGVRGMSNGLVTVHFDLFSENIIRCRIRDNGIGRAAAAQRQAERGKGHRSLGANITMERLRLLHHQQHEEQDPVRTIDLLDEAGQPAGTLVEVLLPIMLG